MLAMWCIQTTCSGLRGPYAPYNKPFISRRICIRYSDEPENQHFTQQYRSQLLTQTIPIGYIFSLWFHLILHKYLATQNTYMVFKLDVLVQNVFKIILVSFNRYIFSLNYIIVTYLCKYHGLRYKYTDILKFDSKAAYFCVKVRI